MNAMQELAEDLARFWDDPFGYVMWAFPWGEKGTVLEYESGPREWQRQFLLRWGEAIRQRGFKGKVPAPPYMCATASGHGIGKSALTAWCIKFILDTRPFSKGVVTANTGDQLKTKTWGELQKWHSLSVTQDLFEYHNTKGNMNLSNKSNPEIWRCDAMTCREENAEAFAGLHAANASPFYIFDEASAIPEKIWEVAHGGLTDGEPFWFCFGNPTRSSGSFRWCFGKNRHRWSTAQIDSRDVEGTNKELFAEWVEDYGEDSDFVRVRIRGLFPRAASCQLISEDLVDAAWGKHLRKDEYSFAARVLGLDVARYGDDKSTLYLRQGLAAWKINEWRGVDLMTLAGMVMQAEDKYHTDATFIDLGMGAGVVDRMRQSGREPIGVHFGGGSTDRQCLNKRSQMWCNMKKWLESGGAIPQDIELREDLVSQEYGFNAKDQIVLMKKEDMKKIGLASPDDGDGLALTFAEPVVPKTRIQTLREQYGEEDRVQTEYDVLAMS